MSPVDVEKRARSLSRAAWVRTQRAEFKAKLKAGGTEQRLKLVTEVLTDVPLWAKNLAVGDFLVWIPRVGPDKRNRILANIGLNPIRRLGYLHASSKLRLLQQLGK